MSGRPTWSFVIAAAGSGSRLGGTPKQFRMLGREQVWAHSARIADALYRSGEIDEIVIVLPRWARDAARGLSFDCPVVIADGGDERAISVLNGLRAASSEFVMIHDAARPFLSEDLCIRSMREAERAGASIPLVPSSDSLKEIEGGDMRVVRRDKIFRTQTPQCFRREELLAIVEASPDMATDEASVWIGAGRKISYVDGDERNFKITTEFDWQVASSTVEQSREIRTGYGYDVHELVPGRRLVLGGVEVDSDLGLLGHSDADIICHSISDALLGAAGEGDIGTLYPASDEAYKDACSMELLRRVIKLVASKRWRIVWVDATLVAQVPRLGAMIPRIRESLARLFTDEGVLDKLSVKVKSGERVGSVGRAESMICHTVATIERYHLI